MDFSESNKIKVFCGAVFISGGYKLNPPSSFPAFRDPFKASKCGLSPSNSLGL